MTTKRRPEHENPPEIFYNDDMAGKYAVNSRIINIQKRMTERAIELLQLPAGSPCHILDVGCGSGLSGEVLESQGHTWVGTDIAGSMLKLCKHREFESSDDEEDDDDEDHDQYLGAQDYEGEEDEEGDDEEDDEEDFDEDEDEDSEGIVAADEDDEDGVGFNGGGNGYMNPMGAQRPAKRWSEVIQADMGSGLPFRAGTFDGIVSISAIQWLCNVDKKGHVPQKRLKALFETLYNCMRRGARAVFQFYPENKLQSNMILRAAMKCGFGGGLVVDFPHSARARKYFLVIYAGLAPQGYQPPKPLSGKGHGFEDVDEFGGGGGEYDDDDEDEEDDDDYERRGGQNEKRARVAGRDKKNQYRHKRGKGDQRPDVGTKEWVLLKKEQRRKYGEDTFKDSKYTMRKRKPRF